MLTYLTVTLTTLGVARLVDDGLSHKVRRYFTNQFMFLPIIGNACDYFTEVLMEHPLFSNFISSFYEWFFFFRLLLCTFYLMTVSSAYVLHVFQFSKCIECKVYLPIPFEVCVTD